ncbi:unnamed protein product [Orchesella dallaii]|uniref:Uncharacterized protein n=1 Tax=Orchesella dallaii TaxID=48710 RepID=A0ABP1RSM4_9HEXA
MGDIKTIIFGLFCVFIIVHRAESLTDEQIDVHNSSMGMIMRVNQPNKTDIPLMKSSSMSNVTTSTTLETPNVNDKISQIWEESKMLAERYNISGCPDMDTIYTSFRSVLGNIDDSWNLYFHLGEVIDKVNASSNPQAQCMAEFFDSLESVYILTKKERRLKELHEFHDATKFKEAATHAPRVHVINDHEVKLPAGISGRIETPKENFQSNNSKIFIK